MKRRVQFVRRNVGARAAVAWPKPSRIRKGKLPPAGRGRAGAVGKCGQMCRPRSQRDLAAAAGRGPAGRNSGTGPRCRSKRLGIRGLPLSPAGRADSDARTLVWRHVCVGHHLGYGIWTVVSMVVLPPWFTIIIPHGHGTFVTNQYLSYSFQARGFWQHVFARYSSSTTPRRKFW